MEKTKEKIMKSFEDLEFDERLAIAISFLNKMGTEVSVEDWPFKFRLEKTSTSNSTYYQLEVIDKKIFPKFRERYLIFQSSERDEPCCVECVPIETGRRLVDRSEIFWECFAEFYSPYVEPCKE